MGTMIFSTSNGGNMLRNALIYTSGIKWDNWVLNAQEQWSSSIPVLPEQSYKSMKFHFFANEEVLMAAKKDKGY